MLRGDFMNKFISVLCAALISFNVASLSKIDSNSNYSSKELNWYFNPRNDGLPPEGAKDGIHLLQKFDSYYLGDTSKKILYLTFDEGYENGYTNKILDTLKKYNIKAAFFVVKPYIKANPEIIKRMHTEGHLVCNHSANHPSMASIKDFSKFKAELTEVEEEYKKITGSEMPKYFRPPMGKYSELSLNYTKELSYKTIFWSFAYKDWEVTKQPELEKAKKIILNRTHNGAIVLLHAVSKTNAEILEDLIKSWVSNGYEIRPLSDL